MTRINVYKIEKLENRMRLIQYLAIRALLQREIEVGNNSVLERFLYSVVDRKDVVPEEVESELRDRVKHMARSVGTRCGSSAIKTAVTPIVEEVLLKVKENTNGEKEAM